MAEYQNIFTQVQVQGPVEWGMDNENNMMEERIGKPFFSQLAGSAMRRSVRSTLAGRA